MSTKTVDPPTGPSAGEVVMGCIHRPDPNHGSHYYWVAEGIEFMPPRSDTRLRATWLVLCKKCFRKYDSDFTAHVEAGRVQFGCHTIWPEDAPSLVFIPK